MGMYNNSNDKRRWSLPSQTHTNHDRLHIEPIETRSTSVGPDQLKNENRKNSVSNYDSETDWFISDQEEELIRILEDSSQDEIDNYEMQVEDLCNNNKKVDSVVSLNSSHTQWSYKNFPNYRNSLPVWKSDMEFRILRYAQMIVENECKKLEEVVMKLDEEERNKIRMDKTLRFDSLKRLDMEMKNIVRVINDLDSVNVIEKPKVVVKVDRRKKIILPKIQSINKTESIDYLENIHTKEEYWQIFNMEAEIWKALFLRNHEKSLETKRKLDQFSGEELRIGEICDKKEKKLSEIPPFESLEKIKNIESIQKFDNVISDLNDFSKRSFNFKGFDPIINDLLNIINLQVKRSKMKDESVAQAFDNIYADASDIENAELTFEELCKMEQHYEEIERLYRKYYEEEIIHKFNNNTYENVSTKSNKNRTKDVPRVKIEDPDYRNSKLMSLDDLKRITSKLEKRTNIIENIEQNTNIIRNIVLNSQQHQTSQENDAFTKRIYNIPIQRESNVEELSINYPMQFYANNWWSIYDDIVKNRTKQFGTIEGWWNYYENIPKRQFAESGIKQPVCIFLGYIQA